MTGESGSGQAQNYTSLNLSQAKNTEGDKSSKENMPSSLLNSVIIQAALLGFIYIFIGGFFAMFVSFLLFLILVKQPDLNESGWFFFIALMPIIFILGSLIYSIWASSKAKRNKNKKYYLVGFLTLFFIYFEIFSVYVVFKVAAWKTYTIRPTYKRELEKAIGGKAQLSILRYTPIYQISATDEFKIQNDQLVKNTENKYFLKVDLLVKAPKSGKYLIYAYLNQPGIKDYYIDADEASDELDLTEGIPKEASLELRLFDINSKRYQKPLELTVFLDRTDINIQKFIEGKTEKEVRLELENSKNSEISGIVSLPAFDNLSRWNLLSSPTITAVPTWPISTQIPTPTTQPTLFPEYKDVGEKCYGEVKDGMCIYSSCSYSFPYNMYSSGKTIYENKIYKDFCQSSKYFKKYYCNAIYDGSWGVDDDVFICPDGCAAGACIKK